MVRGRYLVVSVVAVLVSGVATPTASAQSCQSVTAGGKKASAVQASNIGCRSVRAKLKRWLPRSSLPRSEFGWYCARVSGGRRLCSVGNGGGAPHFSLRLRHLHASAADLMLDCPGNHTFGKAYYGDLSVRNMSCRRGRSLLRSGYLTRSGKLRIPRYRCGLIGYYGDGGIHRCARSRYALRVSIGG